MERDQQSPDTFDKLVDELEAFKQAALMQPSVNDALDDVYALPDVEPLRALDLAIDCELSVVISLVRAKNLQKFDPVRFRFIESMLDRAAHHPKADVTRLIEGRARRALADYIASFLCCYDRAKKTLEEIIAKDSESSCHFKKIFMDFDFRGLASAVGRRQSYRKQPLAELLQLMSNTTDSNAADDRMLDDNWLIENVPEPLDVSNPLLVRVAPVRSELKAVRAFKASSQKREVDSRVAQAIDESPENAGPLNPQRLMVRSLSTLRELSPAYLSRFVTMIDAMLWLEAAGSATESGEQTKSAVKSKAATGSKLKVRK